MLNFIKKHWRAIVAFTVIVTTIGGLCTWGIIECVEYNQWYDSLTDEEKIIYEKEKEAMRQNKIHRYEVVSVSQYIKNETNAFGGIVDTDICYAFQYLDGNSLKSIDNFQNLEYGLTRVIVGDCNMYIVDTNGIDDYRYLQLTKETLKNIKITENR